MLFAVLLRTSIIFQVEESTVNVIGIIMVIYTS